MFRKSSFIILTSIILFVILIYLILSIYITTIAIKATRKIPDATPDRVSLGYSVEEFFTEDSIKLNGWFVKNKSLDTVVMIHGVDSNKSDGYMLDLMKDIYDMGYSVFAFDLRAHGDSGGKDLGLAYIEKKDLDAAIHQIRLNHNVTDIVLYGVSYGGTIVISNPNIDSSVKGIIADSPFYDLPELLASEVANRTFIPKPIANLLEFGIIRSVDLLYDIKTEDIISGIQSIKDFQNPVLIFHCIADDRVPISHSERINRFLPSDSLLIRYGNCEHANGYDNNKENYLNVLENYIDSSFGRNIEIER